MSRAVGVFVAVVAVLAAAAPAQAAFPGQNGKIAFASNRDGDYEIYVMNPDGSGQTPLTSNTFADANPAWSPDGTRIAFKRGGEIWAMNADGTGQSRITPPFSSGTEPAWSADGARIAFTNGRGIAVINADGTGFYELTPNDTTDLYENIDSQPAWSPDNTTILFSREYSFTNDVLLWAIRPDGTALRQVTHNVLPGEGRTNDTGSAWAPGGPRFAFWRGLYESGTDYPAELLTATEADPDDPVFLTEAGFQPAWSPDGSKIAVSNGDILVIPASGGNAVNLTNAAGDDSEPDWQPIPVNSYARPKSGSWTYASLVPAFEPCTAPDRTHGPPLDFAACAAPRQSSSELTVGAPDANGAPVQATGNVSYGVQPGNPNTPVDEADVQLRASIKDVRNAGTLTDYDGGLWVKTGLRVTDKDNRPHFGGAGAATVSDTSFVFHVPCAVTPDTTVGSTCSVLTSADAVLGGVVKERLRAVWQLGRIGVYDGADKLFMSQGVFVP